MRDRQHAVDNLLVENESNKNHNRTRHIIYLLLYVYTTQMAEYRL